jgi:hypothetical protein
MTRQPMPLRPSRDEPIYRSDRSQSLSQDIAGWVRRWLRVPEPTALDLGEIKRLAMQAGDILVYRYPGALSGKAADTVREQLARVFGPDRKVLILDGGADFEVISPPPPSSANE